MKIAATLDAIIKAARKLHLLFAALEHRDSYKTLSEIDVLLICHDDDRGETLQGRPYSRLIDSVSDDLVSRGWRCAQFALPYSRLLGELAWGEPVSANRSLFVALILQRMSLALARMDFGLESGLVKYLRDYRQRLYEAIFAKAKPACVITIGAPADICKVARNQNIPIIELLHGSGIPVIPWGWDKRAALDLPTGIFSMDDVSTRTFSGLKSKGVEVFQIADPWLSRFIDPVKRNSLPDVWKDTLDWIPQGKKVIIVTLTWGYDKDHGPYAEYADILPNGLMHEELVRAIEQTHDSCFWLIRRHPVQIRSSRYKHQAAFLDGLSAQNPNCDWKRSSTLPFPLLLSHCDGHLTMMSVSAYDAAYMGVPTLLLCPTLKPGGGNELYFKDLIAEGYARLGNFDSKGIQDWASTITRFGQAFHSTRRQEWASALEWMLGSECKNVSGKNQKD